MSTKITELLGEHLLEHDQSGEKTNQIPTKQYDGKAVGLYFSAHWCPPCRRFTPKLAETYKEVQNEIKDKFDIIFVSCDQDQESFDEYYKEMPWKALPFSDRDRSKELGEKFKIEGIPCLVVLSPTCETITSAGVEEFRCKQNDSFRKWSEGKRLFWSREAREGEYVWEDSTCSNCYMSPLIGSRRGCTHRDCDVDLCETCSKDFKHDHPLVEYLQPKTKYSMEKLFQSVPHLLKPDSDEKIETKTLWEDGVKSVGFYFSAHWCPPCRGFTPELAKIYKEAQADAKGFRLVFISCDRDEESFNEYRKEMPWPAVPLADGALLKSYFRFSGIPALFILKTDGQTLSRRGRDDVLSKGVEAMKVWSNGESLPAPSPDEYVWSSVSCDGCKMGPLVGQRYYCETCGNYDLCSACEKKGHEHPLTLVPQPTDDDE